MHVYVYMTVCMTAGACRGIGSPGAGVTSDYEHFLMCVLGTELQIYERVACVLNHLSSSPPPLGFIITIL